MFDGCGFMFDLYGECGFDWRDGGRYPQYYDEVSEFFRDLIASGITPIIIIDGVQLDDTKFHTLLQRKQQSVTAITQAVMKGRMISFTPLFMLVVFIEAYRHVGCKLIFPDGEADAIVAQKANELNCPVIANDSDFFIFPLREGFILYELFRYDPTSRRYEAKIFKQKDFIMKHLPQCTTDNSILYLIPAIIGNDFLDDPDEIDLMPFIPSYKKCPICRGKQNVLSRIHSLLIHVGNSCVHSLDEYVGMSSKSGIKTRRNIEECKKIYLLLNSKVIEYYPKRDSWLKKLYAAVKV